MVSIHEVSITDNCYPELLKKVPGAPKTLYVGGDLSGEGFGRCVAFVGSRRMSPYGEKCVEHLLAELSKEHLTVVSGFVQGVDLCVHLTALARGLRTIAVLPYGINYLPADSEQVSTLRGIVEAGGLVVSEFAGTFSPKQWTYPKRNRIIAGVSSAVAVVEATLNSGSLITASFATKYGRKLFAVPGSIFSAVSAGCLHLLTLGATPLYSGSQINAFLGFGLVGSEMAEQECREVDGIVSMLKAYPMTLDELSEVTRTSIPVLSHKVTLLVLSGDLYERGGRFYAN